MPRTAATLSRSNSPAPYTLQDPGRKRKKSRVRPLSCAECKRLKLKCSRTWPCTSCTKRGCAQICPTGQMRTGKGKRLILANTEELHLRVAELELALAESHSLTSTDAHPLLSTSYTFAPLTPVSYAKNGAGGKRAEAASDDDEDLVDGSFGTLTLGTEGRAVFVGSGAGSEYLRKDATLPPGTPKNNVAARPFLDPPSSAQAGFSPTIDAFPFRGSSLSLDALREALPDWDTEGKLLIESYWDNVSWLFDVIPRELFDADHLVSAYSPLTSPHAHPSACAHKLACVFLVMALGALFDLHRQTHDARAEQLFALGRQCLAVTGLERNSIATVQALLLYGQFELNSRDDNGAEAFWPVLGSAVNCAISLGLHRDGEPFGLAEHEVVERRKVFWELAIQERLQALCFARPSSLASRFTDTQRPGMECAIAPDATAFHEAKYRVADIIERVIEQQTRIGPGPYSAIIQLEHDLTSLQRDLPTSLLATLHVMSLPMERGIHPHLRLVLRLLICVCRMYLHRPSFARALHDSQEDPSATKFGSSFTALYESAFEMVNTYKQLIMYHPSLVARFHFLHFHTFSAAVCLGAIAIKAPRCAFANPALHGMIAVTDLCLAAHDSSRAKIGLPILLRMRQSAYTVMSNTLHNNRPVTPCDGREDDLSHLTESTKLRRLQETSPEITLSSPNWSTATDQAFSHQYASSHCRDDSFSSESFTSAMAPLEAPVLIPWFGEDTSHSAMQPSFAFGDAAMFANDLYLGPPDSFMQQAPGTGGPSEQLYSATLPAEMPVYNAYGFDLDNFIMQLGPRSD